MTDDLPNDPGAVIVRRYGLRPPLDWGKDCDDEMSRMTDLWNALVAIERDHRAVYFAATADDPDVAATEAARQALADRRGALVQQRADLRKAARKRVATPELDAMIAETAAQAKEATVAAKAARQAAREKIKPRLRATEQQRHDRVKIARQQSGLWWGNYNAIVASYETARSRALKTGAELHERRHNGEGRLVNQIQGGMSADDLFGGARSQVSVAPLPDDAYTHPSRGEQRRKQYTRLTATVYTRNGERRNVTWPMYMHRPLPDGARIKEVVITRRRVADRYEWHVVFTCRSHIEMRDPARGVCGVDVGWRKVPGGLRVATVASDAGEDYLILPDSLIEADRHCDDIAARRAQERNDIVAQIRAADWSGAPAEIADHVQAIMAAEKVTAGMVARLARSMRSDDWLHPLRDDLSGWQRDDRIDWQEFVGLRRRIVARRKQVYQLFAKQLVARHGVIAVEKIDWAQQARRKDGDDESVHYYRRLAAPGELVSTVAMTAARDGATIVRHEGRSSHVCPSCGDDTAPADRSTVQYRCAACGEGWDQDVAAARVMRAGALSSGDAPPDRPGPLEENNADREAA